MFEKFKHFGRVLLIEGFSERRGAIEQKTRAVEYFGAEHIMM